MLLIALLPLRSSGIPEAAFTWRRQGDATSFPLSAESSSPEQLLSRQDRASWARKMRGRNMPVGNRIPMVMLNEAPSDTMCCVRLRRPLFVVVSIGPREAVRHLASEPMLMT